MASTKYVAHRGLSMHAPENTLPAFELAGRKGFWGIECDTYCTTDGRWIVHHDRTVDRMTDGTGKTKDFSFAEIRKLNIISGNGIEDYPGLRVPTLEEVLDVCKTYRMHAFIEIEEYHHEADLNALLQLVDACGMRGEISFICFNADDLRKVRAMDSEVPLGYLSEAPTLKDIEMAMEMKPMFLNYSYKNTSLKDIQACKASGLEVSLWTINDREVSSRFVEAGVEYITTDTILDSMEKAEG